MIGDCREPQPARAFTPQPRTITLIVQPGGACDIYEAEACADGLNFDEVLGEISRLLMRGPWSGRYMVHVDRRLARLEGSADTFAVSGDFAQVRS